MHQTHVDPSDTMHMDTENQSKHRTDRDESDATVLMSTLYGVLIVLLSGFLYSVLAALVKWGDTIGHTGAMMLFYQSVFQIGFALLTPMYKCKLCCHIKQMCHNRTDTTHDTTGHATHPEGQSNSNLPEMVSLQQMESIAYPIIDDSDYVYTPWVAILCSGFFGAISTYAYFKAAQLIPIGSAVTLTSLSCVSSSLFGWILFRDLMTRYHIVAFILALNGALLISQPAIVFQNTTHGNAEYDDTYWFGSIVALICAVMLGFLYLSVRFARGTSQFVLMMSHGIGSILLALILMFPFDFKWIQSTEDVICILSIGFVGFVAQWIMIKGTNILIEGVSSLLRSCINIICSFIFQIVLFQMYPDTLTVIGTLMILAALVIISMERSRAAVEERKQRSNVSLHSISCDTAVV